MSLAPLYLAENIPVTVLPEPTEGHSDNYQLLKFILQVTQVMLSTNTSNLFFPVSFCSDQGWNRPNRVRCLPHSYHLHSAPPNLALRFYFLGFFLLLQRSQVIYFQMFHFYWNIVSVAHIHQSSDTSTCPKNKIQDMEKKIFEWKNQNAFFFFFLMKHCILISLSVISWPRSWAKVNWIVSDFLLNTFSPKVWIYHWLH